MRYVCSHCGSGAYYDGRCGDGPVLVCGCDRKRRVTDRFGTAYIPTTDAKPIPEDDGEYEWSWSDRR